MTSLTKWELHSTEEEKKGIHPDFHVKPDLEDFLNVEIIKEHNGCPFRETNYMGKYLYISQSENKPILQRSVYIGNGSFVPGYIGLGKIDDIAYSIHYIDQETDEVEILAKANESGICFKDRRVRINPAGMVSAWRTDLIDKNPDFEALINDILTEGSEQLIKTRINKLVSNIK